MRRLSRSDVIRKCIVVFDALKRAMSKGNAGFEPMQGAEESFRDDDEICAQLREILREMEAGEHDRKLQKQVEDRYEKILRCAQDDTGVSTQDDTESDEISPLAALGRNDNAGEMKDWQKEAAGGPPERMVF